MNYEFIIGTVIGVAGLALTWICSKDQIKSYFKPNMQELLNQLVSRNLSIEGKKKVLKKIDRKLKIYGKKYIVRLHRLFLSSKYGKEYCLT